MTDIWPITFDAKLYMFRRNKDGIIWGVVVDPHAECIPILAAADVGFNFQITLCPMLESPAGEPQERRQASQAPAGVAKTEGERAVQRAAIMVKKSRFSDWINEGNDVHPINPNLYLYGYCGISSKADLATNPDGRQKFYDLESKFRAWEQDHPL